MSIIESKDETVSGIFKDFYVVPSYQREYVWTEEQVDQLLQDIRCAQLDSAENEYFIGSIVICPSSTSGIFDLIDGQQRLTTLFVILCAIRDILKKLQDDGSGSINSLIAATAVDHEGNDHYRARLDPQYSDARDIFTKLTAGFAPEMSGTKSMINIANAYAVSISFLDEEFSSNVSLVKKFYAYLIHKVKLIKIRTDSISRALKIFETINDRGVGLDAVDLLKNLLFMKTSQKQFDNLKKIWKKLTDDLHEIKENPIRFLRYFVFSTYGVSGLNESDLYDWFVKHEKIVGYGDDPIKFVLTMQDALNAYSLFLQGKGRDGQKNPALESLRLIAGPKARQHLILLVAGRDLPFEIFSALCTDIELLIFNYVITRENKRDFEFMFPEWAMSLVKVKTLIDYEAFSKETILKKRAKLASRFKHNLSGLTCNTIRNYQLRYMLGKITQYVDQMAYGNSAKMYLWLSHYYDGKDIHIEHILPQSLDSQVKIEFGEGVESPEFLWSIGNLTLAEKSINTSLGKKPFSYKKNIYPKSHFILTRAISSEINIGNTAIDRATSGLKPFEVWTKDSILLRAQCLTEIAFRIWAVTDAVTAHPLP